MIVCGIVAFWTGDDLCYGSDRIGEWKIRREHKIEGGTERKEVHSGGSEMRIFSYQMQGALRHQAI